MPHAIVAVHLCLCQRNKRTITATNLSAPIQSPAVIGKPIYFTYSTSIVQTMPSPNSHEHAHGFIADVWKPEVIDTAANAYYLNPIEREVVIEINKARTDPARFAQTYLEPLRDYYHGTMLEYPGEIPIVTEEGGVALEGCIYALKTMQSLPPLYPKQGLSHAARDQVNDQGRTGNTGHAGSDGSTSESRVSRYGRWGIAIGENIGYGHSQARRIVIALLIDDGVPSRGHRSNLYDPKYQYIGVAVGLHPHFGHMCVMDFSGAYD